LFALSAGIPLRIQLAPPWDWGRRLFLCTGSAAHLRRLAAFTGSLRSLAARTSAVPEETDLYRKFGLAYIEPELREGGDEVEQAAAGTLPELVTAADIRGDLHAHSMSSDGVHSIEQMARAARLRGYEYLGISDHSQSLKIARGLPPEMLWQQIRLIDQLNERLDGFRILKSAEVDILADGGLDYPDELLRELDYTICSIHSRFALGPAEQTERLLRAMDNRYFHILGHATGRLLLKRPGYEFDVDRVIEHARQAGCFFEINSSPDRLDLSAENVRRAAAAGVKIAINTDSHSTGELGLIAYGIDQARRAGLEKAAVLNCYPWQELSRLLRR
jgi:DNA polymerase (family 10)